jgi:hypothetical protein
VDLTGPARRGSDPAWPRTTASPRQLQAPPKQAARHGGSSSGWSMITTPCVVLARGQVRASPSSGDRCRGQGGRTATWQDCADEGRIDEQTESLLVQVMAEPPSHQHEDRDVTSADQPKRLRLSQRGTAIQVNFSHGPGPDGNNQGEEEQKAGVDENDQLKEVPHRRSYCCSDCSVLCYDVNLIDRLEQPELKDKERPA